MSDAAPDNLMEFDDDQLMLRVRAPPFEGVVGVDEDDETQRSGTDEEEDEDEEEEADGEDEVPVVEPHRISGENVSNLSDSDGNERRRAAGGGGEVVSSCKVKESEIGEIEGLFCPICMDAWTNGGDHHICCLPCGHLYGMSCIKKWLEVKQGSAKCPQCNRKYGVKGVRKLFAPKIVVIDELSQKMRLLDSRCDALEKKVNDLEKKEADLSMQVRNLMEMMGELRGGQVEIVHQQTEMMRQLTAYFAHTGFQCPPPQ